MLCALCASCALLRRGIGKGACGSLRRHYPEQVQRVGGAPAPALSASGSDLDQKPVGSPTPTTLVLRTAGVKECLRLSGAGGAGREPSRRTLLIFWCGSSQTNRLTPHSGPHVGPLPFEGPQRGEGARRAILEYRTSSPAFGRRCGRRAARRLRPPGAGSDSDRPLCAGGVVAARPLLPLIEHVIAGSGCAPSGPSPKIPLPRPREPLESAFPPRPADELS